MSKQTREARRLAEIHEKAARRDRDQHNPSGDSKYAKKLRGIRTPASVTADEQGITEHTQTGESPLTPEF